MYIVNRHTFLNISELDTFIKDVYKILEERFTYKNKTRDDDDDDDEGYG